MSLVLVGAAAPVARAASIACVARSEIAPARRGPVRADALLGHLGAGRVGRGPISNSFATVSGVQTISRRFSASEKL